MTIDCSPRRSPAGTLPIQPNARLIYFGFYEPSRVPTEALRARGSSEAGSI